MIRSSISIALCLVCLSSCQTPYLENGFSGGVTAVSITNNTYRISARGNGYTNSTTIQDYVLLKAAEVTLGAGATHFAIVNSNDATDHTVGQTAGTFNTNFYGNTAFTTYNPGMTYDIVKPGQDLIIQIFKDAEAPAGAFPARQVFDNINPRVVRPK